MAQNLVINGVTYNAVSSLEIPKSGGGNAVFPDTSDATAAEADIASGKTAYVNGSKITGTASGGAAEWSPHPDWWDIETIVNTGIAPWREGAISSIRYAYVLRDVSASISLPSGYAYYTSDGGYYSNGGTHTWDISKDKPCADGYKTRAVVVAGGSSTVNPDFIAIPCLYVYFGDCEVDDWSFGTADRTANRFIQAVHCSPDTTGTGSTKTDGFRGCVSLQSLEIPPGKSSISTSCFRYTRLKRLVIPEGIGAIGSYSFQYVTTLEELTIPSTATSQSTSTFEYCTGLKTIHLPTNFNFDLALPDSAQLTIDSVLDMFDKLKDNTGGTAKTLTLDPSFNLILTAAQKAIATGKNWTLAFA